MICNKLDWLDARFVAVRNELSPLNHKGPLTEERRKQLEEELLKRHIAVMDHKMFGHWPSPCPGD